MSNLSGEQIQIKNYKDNNYLDNPININSQRIRIKNKDNKSKNVSKINPNNSRGGFYLPQLNNGKSLIQNDSGLNNINLKLRNKLNISQFRFKINHGNKKGINLNNKLLIIPGNNYQPIFKRSESTGFINFGTNISNKSNKAIKNNYTKKNFVGISNSLLNNAYNYYNDKKLYRNASDIFH